MTPYYETERGKLYCGDCLEVMAQFEAESIGAMLTDAPYGLSFMGAEWDYDVPSVEIWKECLRILKPGAHALIFAGSRTQHRMAVNVEDAGFFLKDTLMWLHGQGFPKNTDISKKLDLMAGKEREIVAPNPHSCAGRQPGVMHIAGANKRPAMEAKMKLQGVDKPPITAPATPEAELWNGWGTHLKPAFEPVLLAMKPNDGSYAQNALKHGVAGLNIEGCMISVDKNDPGLRPNSHNHKHKSGSTFTGHYNRPQTTHLKGRHPANVMLDDAAARLLDQQSGVLKNGGIANKPYKQTKMGIFTPGADCGSSFGGDQGGASRYFKNIAVDLNDISTYNKTILNNLKQETKQCGNIIENQKIVGILNGAILEAEKYIQNAELFLYGKKITEQDLLDMKSTISTLIKRMIELKTCNVFLEENIDFFMEESEKTIKLLMGLNTESAKLAKNIKSLIIFGSGLLELIAAIVKLVHLKNSENGAAKTENTTINICENTEKETKKYKRFFFCAKASAKDRGRGNNHATVKPTKLIEYLLTLLSYPEDIVTVDPFGGSGTFGVVCEKLKRKWIICEQDESNCEIAARRIEEVASQMSF